MIAALQKFCSLVQRYPTDTQYDLVACYCRTSSDCSDILQLLESLAKKSDSSASAQNSEKAAKSEKVWSCHCALYYCNMVGWTW